MQKLSGTSSGKNNKSCGIFYRESNKIGFVFFWFFYDFLCNLQVPAKRGILLKMCFAPRPSGRFRTLQPGPRFADKPLERKRTLQLGPPGGRRQGVAGFWRSGGRDRPGTSWGHPLGHPCSIYRLGRGGRVADEQTHRRPAAGAAAGPVAAPGRRGQGKARLKQVLWVQR
jgi:hypothetical protein